MSEQVLKKRLEKAVNKRFTATEWLEIRKAYVREHDAGELSWEDLCGLVDDFLCLMRRVVENTRREERGESLLEAEIPEAVPEQLPEPFTATDITAPLSERTAARAQALVALDNYCLGPANPDRVGSRRISSRVRPQWGFDKTLPQWVIELEIEAWVPAEDVRSIYEHVQSDLLAGQASPKTQPHTFRVAQFVWEEKLRCGVRPSWQDLLKRWKERNPDDKRFSDRRAFRMCFKRGAEATRPRYKGGDERIIGAATRLQQAIEQWNEGPRFGLSPVRRRLF